MILKFLERIGLIVQKEKTFTIEEKRERFMALARELNVSLAGAIHDGFQGIPVTENTFTDKYRDDEAPPEITVSLFMELIEESGRSQALKVAMAPVFERFKNIDNITAGLLQDFKEQHGTFADN